MSKTKKVLLVYNICGIKRDNTIQYCELLQRIIQQKFEESWDVEFVCSACCPNERTIPVLKSHFPSCNFNYTNEILPVNVTFNHAVLESVKRFGKFDTYLYVPCDAFLEQEDVLQSLCNILYDNKNCGILSAQTDNDSCYAYGLKLGGGRHGIDDERARYEMFKDGTDYTVPVGLGGNSPILCYSSALFDYYGKLSPDIFAGRCTESIFTFLVAALKKQWIISKDVLVRQYVGLDGPSSGFNPDARNGSPYDHPFPLTTKTLLPIFHNDHAKSIGIGYAECAYKEYPHIVKHDPSQFDEQGFCINDELKQYIKDNLFLTKDKFDYDKINSRFDERTQ